MNELRVAISQSRIDDARAIVSGFRPETRKEFIMSSATDGCLIGVQLAWDALSDQDKSRQLSKILDRVAAKGHLDILRWGLLQSPRHADCTNAIRSAARTAKSEALRILINHDPTLMSDAYLLRRSAANGDIENAKVLLTVSTANAIDRALAMAAQHGRLEMCRLLLPKARPIAVPAAIIKASSSANLEVLKLLLDQAQDAVDPKALIEAVQRRRAEAIDLLLPRTRDLSLVLCALTSGVQPSLVARIQAEHDHRQLARYNEHTPKTTPNNTRGL